MQENPLVTIICTCFNHEKFVIESLQSVLNQTYKNINIIIVDNFSQDNSIDVIETFLVNYPNILFVKNKKALNITKSFNNAIRICEDKTKYLESDYLIDLAADDVLISNCVEKQVHTFQNSTLENLAIVYGNAELIDENGQHKSFYFDIDANLHTIIKPNSGNIYCDVISEKTVICSVSAMIKKQCFDEINGFNENLLYEDLDFWIRISRTKNIEFIDKILVKKRILKKSMHSNFRNLHSIYGQSTYLILKNAYKLNQSKLENNFLKGRIVNEIKTSIKKFNFILFLKNFNLYIRLLMNFR